VNLAHAMALPLVPDLRPRFHVGELIARGGMASVFEAYDERGRIVAAKIPHVAIMGSETALQRFMCEASLLCSVRSPFIVRGLGMSESHDGRPMLIMDRLWGEDLASTLHRLGQVPIDRAVLSVVHGCTALATLHAMNVIHRDLKPANLYVTRTPDDVGPTVLLDLGVVKSLHAQGAAVTIAGCVVGSPAYMAPEQMLGDESLDHRADIWSIGVLLYELVTGRVPFEGTNIMHVLSRALFNGKPRPSEFRSDVPLLVEDVIDRCLRVEPSDRFACALDVARALLPVLPPALAVRASEAVEACAERPSGIYSLATCGSSFGQVNRNVAP
jgi:serine/threonine-protein kinase